MLGHPDHHEQERMMGKLLAIPAVAACAVGLAAAPATAKPPKDGNAYTATIDCGPGRPIEVVSSDELFAPLVHRPTGRKFHPVAWDVVVGETRIKKSKKGAKKRGRVLKCAYEDHAATGTVTVKKPRRRLQAA
jgi:hypothetical protein